MFPFVFEINPAGWAHLAYFGLFIPALVHVAYDITAGLSYGRLGKEFGYSPELKESPNPSV